MKKTDNVLICVIFLNLLYGISKIFGQSKLCSYRQRKALQREGKASSAATACIVAAKLALLNLF